MAVGGSWVWEVRERGMAPLTVSGLASPEEAQGDGGLLMVV